ncbi:hypothetical protein BcepF1.085 [Burkholderia phage BcepF1]|uniref:Uncharacterized protein n=1 Tax=Burkholderia phage BcepF1 TaxID=2886897 RepID=A1YZY9_9CAUD|nr:hypothetical protein BcepF1.085 [Burkholderia phage BcepF1]ABL96816.1 hypothetical protein BcepF1.085 [Burkholderia phage BcepF1]
MAKANEKSGTELAEVKAGALAMVADFIGAGDFDGAGFEGADADSFAIPFWQVLQKMSPKVDEDNAEYIQGAKAGMFFNTVTGKLLDGKNGFDIIPCAFKRSFILWGGNRGGFKGEFTPEQIDELIANNQVIAADGRLYVPDEKGAYDKDKSDYYADTRSHYVIAFDPESGEFGQGILACSSSQIKSSRNLMTSLSQKKVNTPAGLKTPPSFLNVVHVSTVGMTNDKGSWSGLKFDLVGLVTDAGRFTDPKTIYEAAKQFYELVKTGEAKADFAKAGAEAAGANDGVANTPSEADNF